jgi:hypothetical protein
MRSPSSILGSLRLKTIRLPNFFQLQSVLIVEICFAPGWVGIDPRLRLGRKDLMGSALGFWLLDWKPMGHAKSIDSKRGLNKSQTRVFCCDQYISHPHCIGMHGVLT